jgi:hypothetical protein
MKATRILSNSRILFGFLCLGIFLAAGALYLSWHSLEDEHRELSLPVMHQEQNSSESSGSPVVGKACSMQSPASSAPAFVNATPTDDPSGARDANPTGGSPEVGGSRNNVSKAASDSGMRAESDSESPDEATPPPPPPGVFNALNHPELTDIPREAIEGLAQEFVEKVKQGGWDNTSEAYRKNWEKAAEETDETFKAAYGYDAYLKLTSGGTN